MNLNAQRAYQNYRRTSVETASPGKLLIMLYDGALKFLAEARQAIQKKDYAAANQYLCKTQDIISELDISLNPRAGELSVNLRELYRYLYQRLIEANVKKDLSIIDEVKDFLQEMRETWSQVVSQNISKTK